MQKINGWAKFKGEIKSISIGFLTSTDLSCSDCNREFLIFGYIYQIFFYKENVHWESAGCSRRHSVGA